MPRRWIVTAAATVAAMAALLTATSASALGRADVRYVKPEAFVDAGSDIFDRQRTQALLREHFERLARQLPDGQVLQVQVTEVDLAGEIDTVAFHRIRVLGQFPDAPRVILRYELRQGDQVLAQGEDDIFDANYQSGGGYLRGGEALGYERRMLDRWFRDRFPPAASANPGTPAVR
jgi:Protein of unknown function (DUF3016)